MARPVSPDVVIPGSRRRAKLEAIVARTSSPQNMVLRARIVLLAWQDRPNTTIAAELGTTVDTVRKWRHRFVAGGLPALKDQVRHGRPETYGPDVRLAVIACATSVPPSGESQWSHLSIARHLAHTAISPSQVGRILAEADLRPHKVRGWLNRVDDEQFWAQAAAVCDLYLRPPRFGVLISVDEKTGIQAKSRKYPERAGRPGRPARREFEYIRHGTVSIIAAMNVTNGQVLARRIERNNSVTFISFLTEIDQAIDPKLDIYLIMDNGSSHTSRATRAWLAAHPRFKVTYTPKHASWLNMVEMWLSALTRRLLRRGEFTSRDDLTEKIIDFTIRYNNDAHPYRWSYDARAEHARYQARHARDNEHHDGGRAVYAQAA
ncbi:transposase [Streptosporangium album]|uniref:Transposase n=1 Tax=Streptosporangium album TaxID=47479 RepID=A0A7W7RYH9_9ACTN|nr:IS630 family transposase [Streptosporangium album]MBB4940427.1 transposase [Streptosporangium album]